MNQTIVFLKYARLLVSIMMLIAILAYHSIATYFVLPDLELIVTMFVSVFVFLLGAQYYFEKKLGIVSIFLMVFSIVMLIMSILGVVL